MLKQLTTVKEYMDFINEINNDPSFSEPMLRTDEQIRCNLLDAPGKPSNQVWGIFDENADNNGIIGLFVFLILEDEAYIEMLVGLSRNSAAYQEMLSHLKAHYSGYQADFVYNPANHLLHSLLQNEKAEFEAEQQKMVLKNHIPFQSNHQIELYNPKYRQQYLSMHADDCYWTAEKVLDAPDRFRVILAIENATVVGYLDVTYSFKENEPYDIFVKEESRGKGYGKAMLAKAIELNKPRGMMLLADADNAAAIAMCQSLGFVQAAGENNLTAHVLL